MDVSSRRQFLQRLAAFSGATLLAQSPRMSAGLSHSVSAACLQLDPPKGQQVGTLPFVGERRRLIGKPYGSGLNGRLLCDLTQLDHDRMVVPNDQFFIRTRFPGGLDLDQHDPWTIKIHGLVEKPLEIPLSDWTADVVPMGTHVMECSGNSSHGGFGLLSAAEWSGIPLEKILQRVTVLPRATRVLIAGFDEHSERTFSSSPEASWVFTFEQLFKAKAFLATEMNGTPLPKDHGFPVRLIVPGWYGCTCAKWVHEIELVDDIQTSTRQMREFAGRTHQSGTPKLAKDYLPATMDLAAMPVRVEQWQADDKYFYRVIGILWGGDRLTDRLMIQLGRDQAYVPVDSCQHTNQTTWTLWSHRWQPKEPGRYRIRLKVDDPAIRTRRLDRGYYRRSVEVTDV